MIYYDILWDNLSLSLYIYIYIYIYTSLGAVKTHLAGGENVVGPFGDTPTGDPLFINMFWHFFTYSYVIYYVITQPRFDKCLNVGVGGCSVVSQCEFPPDLGKPPRFSTQVSRVRGSSPRSSRAYDQSQKQTGW